MTFCSKEKDILLYLVSRMCHRIAEVCILKKFKEEEAMWVPESIKEENATSLS